MQTSTTDQFQVEHIEYVSEHPFDDVVAALEKATGDVTDGKFETEVASAKDKEDFEKRARSFEADSGFMRFLSLNHGEFLTLMGFPAKVRQYTIGNPLIAATMLLHDIGAALNVPVRLVIYEGTDGRTRLGYDRPSSLMERLGNPELSTAARKLDAKLAALAESVTAG
jgi:uncharacterized protein (DUF302 family)